MLTYYHVWRIYFQSVGFKILMKEKPSSSKLHQKGFDLEGRSKNRIWRKKRNSGGEGLSIRLPRISKYHRNWRERLFWATQKNISQTKPPFGTFWHLNVPGRVKNDEIPKSSFPLFQPQTQNGKKKVVARFLNKHNFD